MEVKINLETETVEELKKDIEVLQYVIKNKEQGLPATQGLEQFISPQPAQTSTQETEVSKEPETPKEEPPQETQPAPVQEPTQEPPAQEPPSEPKPDPTPEESAAAQKAKEMKELVDKVDLSEFLSNMD